MNRMTVVLIVIAVLLGCAYLYFFSDLFASERIQIIPQPRTTTALRAGRPKSAVAPISFTLDGSYRLTSVKVVDLTTYKTNKFAPPLWYLVSPSNSVPTRGFTYGQTIRGMKPKYTNSTTRRLEPNMTYRLFIEAGKAKGEQDFRATGPLEAGN
jgi:hypothetical protein